MPDEILKAGWDVLDYGEGWIITPPSRWAASHSSLWRRGSELCFPLPPQPNLLDHGGSLDHGLALSLVQDKDHLVASVWSEMNSCQQSRLPAFHPGVLSNILNQLLVNKNNCLNSTQSTRITMSKICTYTAKGLSSFLYTFRCQIGSLVLWTQMKSKITWILQI